MSREGLRCLPRCSREATGGLSLEDIDQIVMDAIITNAGDRRAEQSHHAGWYRCCLIRLGKDVDWAKF